MEVDPFAVEGVIREAVLGMQPFVSRLSFSSHRRLTAGVHS
jgi:hypothetical protein